MSQEKHLSSGAKGFLWVVAILADGTKILLDLFFGIGFILDPLLVSPVTWMIFLLTFAHNGVPMFSGKHGWAGWTNIIVAEIPGIDAIPDWSLYMLYMSATDTGGKVSQGIL